MNEDRFARGSGSRLRILLVSTYELGRQPFGVASPAAWLTRAGFSVRTVDLSVEMLADGDVREADLFAMYVPMHTASRLAADVVRKIRVLNPSAHLCFYGLYAPMNEEYFRSLGAVAVLGGEYEEGLVSLAERLARGGKATAQEEPVISLGRQHFVVPDRSDMPPLERYASLVVGDALRTVGYTEASRGCKHLCRHCPIVPVYGGRFRVVQRDVVLDDIRQQVDAGAQHITFGDPDFFNGPAHAIALVQEVHRLFPSVTYDVTIKIEHLLRHQDRISELKHTGCLFVTSAVESIDDRTLEIYDKQHTRQDFEHVVRLFRDVGLELSPTFVTFSPWTTLGNYAELLDTIIDLDLVPNVSPVQYAIRLLIPAGSRLLELEEVRQLVGPFDAERLCYPWTHPDPRVDGLCDDILEVVNRSHDSRAAAFADVWSVASHALESEPTRTRARVGQTLTAPTSAIPHINEPWYCCAEPTEQQIKNCC
jgi:radical SAM superfamily enzyme YgiQ (UPF0313 family)